MREAGNKEVDKEVDKKMDKEVDKKMDKEVDQRGGPLCTQTISTPIQNKAPIPSIRPSPIPACPSSQAPLEPLPLFLASLHPTPRLTCTPTPNFLQIATAEVGRAHSRFVLTTTTTKDSAAPVLSFGNGHLIRVVALAETNRTSSLRRQCSFIIEELSGRWSDSDVVVDLHRGTESSPLQAFQAEQVIKSPKSMTTRHHWHEQHSLYNARRTARVNKYGLLVFEAISKRFLRRLLMRFWPRSWNFEAWWVGSKVGSGKSECNTSTPSTSSFRLAITVHGWWKGTVPSEVCRLSSPNQQQTLVIRQLDRYGQCERGLPQVLAMSAPVLVVIDSTTDMNHILYTDLRMRSHGWTTYFPPAQVRGGNGMYTNTRYERGLSEASSPWTG
ncbi:hypothetical protein E6O75_ATG00469 [Venturia nashicola]|uniref:Uncharacterized protein n=1 Tax=Venturia nashicola TaxID=86259 RepID=A0A4Z1PWY0_9PEZI|nr:hypothetical protein E6O75_ATG00469 [Venturia nashicola]